MSATDLASRMRNRITVVRGTKTQKAKGGWDVVWEDLRTVWAEVIGVNGREVVMAEALQGISVYRITVRFGLDVTPSDQLRYGTQMLNVKSVVDPDGRRDRLLIMADTASTESTG